MQQETPRFRPFRPRSSGKLGVSGGYSSIQRQQKWMYNSSTHLWLPAGAGGVRSLTGRWGEWVNRPSFRRIGAVVIFWIYQKMMISLVWARSFYKSILCYKDTCSLSFFLWHDNKIQQVSSSFDADSWRVAIGGTFCTAQLHAEDTDGAGRPLPSIELLQRFAECFFWHSSMDMDTQNVEDTCCVDIIDIQIIVVVVYLSIYLWWPVFSSNHLPVAVSFQYCRLPNANTLMHGIAVQHDITRLDTTWLDNMIFALLSISHVVTWHCIANSCALHFVPSHILPYLP